MQQNAPCESPVPSLEVVFSSESKRWQDHKPPNWKIQWFWVKIKWFYSVVTVLKVVWFSWSRFRYPFCGSVLWTVRFGFSVVLGVCWHCGDKVQCQQILVECILMILPQDIVIQCIQWHFYLLQLVKYCIERQESNNSVKAIWCESW